MMKEQDLFEYLRDNVWKDLVQSQGTFDTFDCQSDESRVYIELKSRLTHYPTLLLEKKKFDAVTEQAFKLEYAPWYINSTPEGIYGFKLDLIADPQWEMKWLPRTTEFANKGNIDKEVMFLDVNSATFYQPFKQ